MAEVYIEPTIVLDQDDIQFDANLEGNDRLSVAAANWGTRGQNQADYWVVYVCGAFQGDNNRDRDGSSDLGTTLGITVPNGGSFVFVETINDRYSTIPNGITPLMKQRDNVVHEIGHALANADKEPVTGFDADQQNGGPGINRYTAEYRNFIRKASKPLS